MSKKQQQILEHQMSEKSSVRVKPVDIAYADEGSRLKAMKWFL